MEEKEDKKVLSEQEKIDLFLKEYRGLCEKYGYALFAEPTMKYMSDTGTYSIVINTRVIALEKNPQKPA